MTPEQGALRLMELDFERRHGLSLAEAQTVLARTRPMVWITTLLVIAWLGVFLYVRDPTALWGCVGSEAVGWLSLYAAKQEQRSRRRLRRGTSEGHEAKTAPS
jgi:hypothetical protein